MARRLTTTLAFAIPLAGCTTTRHEAQRERLDSARQRAALESTRVTAPNPRVVATAPSTIRAGERTAFVVTVHNRTRHAVSDLPISIGYGRAGRASMYLNSGTDLGYFEAHLPAIGAGRTLTWVFTTARSLPPRAHTFARVGVRQSAPAKLTEMGVRIGVRYHLTSGGRALAIHLQNPTGVPQYELQVYAYAMKDGRYVAAGAATLPDLGAGSERNIRLALVGTATTRLQVEAVPTVLQ